MRLHQPPTYAPSRRRRNRPLLPEVWVQYVTALRDETQSQASTALFASAFRRTVPGGLDDRLGSLESLVLSSGFRPNVPGRLNDRLGSLESLALSSGFHRHKTGRVVFADWAESRAT